MDGPHVMQPEKIIEASKGLNWCVAALITIIVLIGVIAWRLDKEADRRERLMTPIIAECLSGRPDD